MTTTTSAPSSSEPAPRGDSESSTAALYGAVERALAGAALASRSSLATDYNQLAAGVTSGVLAEWSELSGSIWRVRDRLASTLSDFSTDYGGLLADRLQRLHQLQVDDGYIELDIPRPSDDCVRAARQLLTILASSETILALTKLFPSEDGGIVVRIQTQSRVIKISVENDDAETYRADVWEIVWNSAGVPGKGRDVVTDLHFASPSAVAAFLDALTADDV